MMSITVGNISAIRRPTRTDTSIKSVLAPSKRSLSWVSLTNARMTRTPPICSRRIRLSRSILACIERNNGRIRVMISTTHTSRTGTITNSSDDRTTSWRRAMMTPPTHMIGAAIIMVKVSSTNIWTCWMSLVDLVIRDGAPKRPTSCAAKDSTLTKTDSRRSLPSAIAVRAPK